MITTQILQLIGKQHGAIARAQLVDRFGLSSSSIHRACIDGRLIVAAPGVYRLASAHDTLRFRCSAATLFGRGIGFVSGRTAGDLRGLRKMNLGRIHYTVPAGFGRTPPRWMDLNFTTWYDAIRDRETTTDGLVVARPLRMLFGMAADFNQFRFDRAADDAWHLKLLTPIEAWRYLQGNRCRGKDGVARFEAWLEKSLEQRAASQSYLERDLIAAVEQIGLPVPTRQHRLTLRNGETIHLDAAWPEMKFGIEPGSTWFHLMDGGQRRDYQRDLACGELGWHILRLDQDILADMDAAARRIRIVYKQRQQDLSIAS
jgi:hypothetical protein